MVVAGLWKRQEIDSLEAGLYRKILFVGSGITNKAILNTMTSIRLAGDAITSIARKVWEDARRQTRLTSYFDKEEYSSEKHTWKDRKRTQGERERRSNRQHKIHDQQDLKPTSKQRSGERREKLYIPRIMAETMLAVTANSTSPHFGLNHMCRKHNVLFTMEHVEGCD